MSIINDGFNPSASTIRISHNWEIRKLRQWAREGRLTKYGTLRRNYRRLPPFHPADVMAMFPGLTREEADEIVEFLYWRRAED